MTIIDSGLLFSSHPVYREPWIVQNISLAAATTRILVTFYFRLQISISGCSFCSQLMNCWNLWISFATCQSGNRSE